MSEQERISNEKNPINPVGLKSHISDRNDYELIKWTKILSIGTGLLALATFIVAGAAAWQVYEMRKADLDNRRSIEASLHIAEESHRTAEAAERSAKANEDSVKTARTNFESDQRPYLKLDRIEGPYLTSDGELYINFYMKNIGKTVISNLVIDARLVLVNSPGKPYMDGERRSGPISSLPNDEFFQTVYSFNSFSKIQLNNIINTNGIMLLLKGKYEDVFGNPYQINECMTKFSSGVLGACVIDDIEKN